VEVGGVGFLVYAPAALCRQAHIRERIHLYTYLVVREDALSLYGFPSGEDRDFFVLLLGANGVGPRTALATLSVLTVDAIRRAVLSEQPDVFARVPGVGRKTAQKIILQLQGKVGKGEGLEGVAGIADLESELIEALTGLGYSIVEAQAAIQAIPRDAPTDLETRLRLALQYFSS
jgi:Holliday junction DNA helicase RuvA